MECTEQGGVAVKFQKGDEIRNMVTMAAAGVPEIGQILSGTLKLFWEDTGPSDLFNQMKAYVDRLVPGLIAQQHVQDLENTLAGLINVMNNYQQAPDSGEKKGHLLFLVDQLALAEPNFFDIHDLEKSRPEQYLAHFIAFGTLKMVALRELYIHGKEYYGSDAGTALHLKNLQDAVKKYTTMAAGIRPRAMDWRRTTLNKYQYDEGGPRPFGTTYYYVSDDVCGWRQEAGSSATYDNRDAVWAYRWAQVEPAYGADLDAILSHIAEWRMLEIPVSPPPPQRYREAGHW